MDNINLNRDQIIKLLPHREPMLLIDELINIIPNKSAVGIVNVKKNSFYFQGHFPGQPVMPNCKLLLEIEAIRSRGRVWRYKGIAKVTATKMADAVWAATIVDRSK